MKKSKLLLLSLLAAASTSVSAAVKPIVLSSPNDYQVIALSPNGKWATGVFVDYSNNTYGFLWNLESNKTTLLSTTTSSYGNAVSNDGVVSGQFTYTPAEGGASFEVPGYYKDGAWHPVQLPNGMSVGDQGSAGQGGGITPDGKRMSGALYINNVYTPFVWSIEDGGAIVRELDITNPEGSSRSGNAFCISPDGMKAGGWAFRYNRSCTIWDVNSGEKSYIGLTDHNHQGPWSSVDKFSPDGKKVLFGGGWDYNVDADSNVQYGYRLYDLETGDITEYPTTGGMATLSLFGISNDYTLVGSNGDYDYGRAIIYKSSTATLDPETGYYKAGPAQYMDDYLTEQGLDLSKLDIFTRPDNPGEYTLFRAQDISADGNVICVLYYHDLKFTEEGDDGIQYSQAALRSMIVMLNQDDQHAAPQDMRIRQLAGLSTVEVKWEKPVRAVEGIKNYAIYRDGGKIATVAADAELVYYDTTASYADHTYYVASVYDDEETKSSEFRINVKEQGVQAPQNLYLRQKGVNSIYAEWETPQSNLITKNWYNNSTANLQGFGVGAPGYSIETGIGFEKEELVHYKGTKLTKVNFIPMSAQQNLKLNIYKYDAEDKPQLIHTQAVTQQLNYRQRNTVTLTKPLDLPTDGDVVVAFSCYLEQGSNDVIGMDYGHYTPGYGDLIRFVDEPDFYSYYYMREAMGSPDYMTFMIDMVLQPEGADESVDAIDHYVIGLQGEEVGTTKGNSFVIPSATILSTGEKKEVGVKTVYQNGKVSDWHTASVDVTAQYVGVDKVDVIGDTESSVIITWEPPMDADKHSLGYCGEQAGTTAANGINGPAENNYGLMAAVKYSPSMTKGYDGYNISSFRFFPTADALFTFFLVEDGRQIAELEVDDYTLGQWNEAKLETPITVKAGSTYYIVLDIYDAAPGLSPLALDNKTPFVGVSDLYSVDASLMEASWASVSDDTGLRGNWMLGLNIEDPNPKPLTASGYDVIISTPGSTSVKKVNGLTKVTTQGYRHDFGAPVSGSGKVRINAYYDGRGAATTGTLNDYTYTYSPYLKGDANGDGVVNVFDVVAISDYILTGDGVKNKLAADYNLDFKIDVYDVVGIAGEILGNE